MVEKEAILELMKEQLYKPMTVQELQEVFSVQTADGIKTVDEAVKSVGAGRRNLANTRQPLWHSRTDERA